MHKIALTKERPRMRAGSRLGCFIREPVRRARRHCEHKEAPMLKAKQMLGVALVLIAGFLLIAQANWDLTKPNTVAGDDPKCSYAGEEVVIWEEQFGGDKPVACALTGTYRAPETRASTCTAELSWISADGQQLGTQAIHKDDGNKPFNIPNAKIVRMLCKGLQEDMRDSCHYEITQISCVKAGDAVNVVPMGAAVERKSVKCGAAEASIWKRPAAPPNKVCNVTVAWTGTKECTATITAKYHGHEKTEEAARKAKLFTFLDVRELLLECKGSGEGKCSYSIVSTECK